LNENYTPPAKNDYYKSDFKPITNKPVVSEEKITQGREVFSKKSKFANIKPVDSNTINNDKENLFEDSSYGINMFDKLLDKDEENSDKFLGKHEPILVNKNNEPHFLHMNDEHKILNKNKEIITNYNEYSGAGEFSPFLKRTPNGLDQQKISNSKMDDVLNRLFKNDINDRQDDNDKINGTKKFLSIIPQNSNRSMNSFPKVFAQPIITDRLQNNKVKIFI